ncbi:DUF6350 family protein [Leifsonia sp. NCR5]|uniref:cell division protein PerM n=1 Tax=Leifsonia sp. NCR5 TaxID=1978342 RepID=UPI000A190A2B|nr:DUF6350 family protein [Leifsonia sp. NCR5]
MNRTTVALLAALEAVIVVAIGLAISLVPLTVLWAAQYHLAADWFTFWRASADIWLVGHGVNLTVTLDAQAAATLGLPGAVIPFQVTIAALGFAVLTAGLGVRTGLRAAETPFRLTGAVSAVVAFAVLSAAVTFSAGSAPVHPSVWQGIVLPPFVYAVGVLCGFGFAALRAERDGKDIGLSDRNDRGERSGQAEGPQSRGAVLSAIAAATNRIPPMIRDASAVALRAGTGAAALVIAGAALVLTILILGNYGGIISLYEQLQAGALGGAALTIAQLAFIPNLVIWLASWMVGPGFAIGTGSSVSPIGTELGPLPGLPLFGVIPAGGFSFGLIGVLVPIVAGFLAAALLRSRATRMHDLHGTSGLLVAALGIGIVAGIELGLLAWWSSGAIGPGRLHDVGPNPWLVGSIAAAEVAVAAIIGLVAGGRARR